MMGVVFETRVEQELMKQCSQLLVKVPQRFIVYLKQDRGNDFILLEYGLLNNWCCLDRVRASSTVRLSSVLDCDNIVVTCTPSCTTQCLKTILVYEEWCYSIRLEHWHACYCCIRLDRIWLTWPKTFPCEPPNDRYDANARNRNDRSYCHCLEFNDSL